MIAASIDRSTPTVAVNHNSAGAIQLDLVHCFDKWSIALESQRDRHNLLCDLTIYQQQSQPSSRADESAGDRMQRIRVLLVEDHADTAITMAQFLETRSYSVRTVGSYREAVRVAGEWLTDILLSDIGLPGKDGCEVMTTMRLAYPTLKGIVISGQASEEDFERCREAGFSEYLVKPITLEDLDSALQRLLG
jgi:CheY-like chemotaxis protein